MRRIPAVEPNLIDRLVTWISPERGIARHRARTMLAMAGGYTGGRRDKRSMSQWSTSGGSADADLEPDRALLIERSRDLCRNAPLARGAVNTVVTNVVGTGLTVQARIDREVLEPVFRGDAGAADAWERAAEREFRLWSESPDCDVTRTQNFAALQSLAFRSVLESGDVFPVRRFVERPNRRLATCLQMIEADRVANPNHRRDTAELTAGVYRDQFGAPVAYNVLNEHPGNNYGLWSGEGVRVPAFDRDGERIVYHLFDRLRPEQTRGVPYLAPVIETLKQLDRYTEAEIMAAVVSGMFTVFVKTEDGSGMGPMEQTTGTGGAAGDKDFKLGPGAILDLLPNEKIETANPGRPNQAFDPFVLAILRQIGVALELPFEVLVKHFTASYSAAQAALLEAWKFFRARRVWLAANFCQPVYEAVISEAVARGFLIAPGFEADPMIRAAYLGAEWIGPPRGQIDQLKEANAAEKWIAIGAKTLAEVTAENTGGDWERKHTQRAKEHQMRVAAGLEQPLAAADRPAAPTLPPATTPDPEDEP